MVLILPRTMKDSFLGARIISLPEAFSHDQWITLSEEERLIYE